MNRSIVVVLVILLACITQAQAQTQTQTSEERPFQVFVLGGLGHTNGGGNRFQIGGGAEAFVFKGVAAGGEFSRILGSQGAGGLNSLSANGSFHFLTRGKFNRFDPFATGGYTRFFSSGTGVNAVNFGGGMNYWLSEGFGLRMDFRDSKIRGGGSLIGLRGGVVLGF